MTIDVEKTTADGRRALERAQRRASKVVDHARSVDVPTLSDLGVPTLSDLGHRLDHVPAELEQAVGRRIRAAKQSGRRARRKGLVAPPAHRSALHRRGSRTARRTTGIVVVLGIVVATVMIVAKQRRAKDAAETSDPFGAVRESEGARRAASSAERA